MAVYSNPLSTLTQMLATSFNDCLTGTPEATMSNSGFVCSYLIEPTTNYFKNASLHFYAGTHAGSTRQITTYNSTSYAVAFLPVLANSVVANCTFQVHQKHTWVEYKDSINYAIERAKDLYLLNKVDETLTFTTDTYEYAVPTGFRYIQDIYYEDITDANTYYDSCMIHPAAWTILKHPTSPKIKFHDKHIAIGSDFNGQYMRVVGQSVQSTLTNDSDVCYLPTHVILGLAKAYIFENEGKINESMAARTTAEKYLKESVTPPLSGSLSVFEV